MNWMLYFLFLANQLANLQEVESTDTDAETRSVNSPGENSSILDENSSKESLYIKTNDKSSFDTKSAKSKGICNEESALISDVDSENERSKTVSEEFDKETIKDHKEKLKKSTSIGELNYGTKKVLFSDE